MIRAVTPAAPFTWENLLLAASITLLPLFYLTVKNWSETWLVVLALVSGYGIWKSRLPLKSFFPDRWTTWIFIALVAPLVGNVAAFLLRGDLRPGMLHYDWDFINGPSRAAMAALAFLWMRKNQASLTPVFRVICPLSLLLIPLFICERESHRFSTHIIDVDNISMQVVLLASFVLIMQLLDRPKSLLLMIANIAAILIAVYVSLISQGRGGWIAVPVILILAFLMHTGSKVTLLKLLLIPLVAIVISFSASKTFSDRIISIYTEIHDWKTDDNKVTANGTRFTMWKMSWHLIKQKPLLGYGHRDMLWGPVYTMDKSIYGKPTDAYENKEYARLTLCSVGAHNQVFQDLLRGGIVVLITSLGLWFIPLALFFKRITTPSRHVYLGSCLGIVLISCFLVFSISQGPFGLKVFWSFYGFMIAALASQVLSDQDTKNPLKHPEPSQA
jgi:O-antigen ligase